MTEISATQENRGGKKDTVVPCWQEWEQEQVLIRVVSRGHTEKTMFEQSPEGGEGVNHAVNFW